MNKLPKKFVERVLANLKKYQRIAETQQKADSAEADTVTLVKDILADIFGYHCELIEGGYLCQT